MSARISRRMDKICEEMTSKTQSTRQQKVATPREEKYTGHCPSMLSRQLLGWSRWTPGLEGMELRVWGGRHTGRLQTEGLTGESCTGTEPLRSAWTLPVLPSPVISSLVVISANLGSSDLIWEKEHLKVRGPSPQWSHWAVNRACSNFAISILEDLRDAWRIR